MQSGVACISPVTIRFRNQDVPHLLELTKTAKRIIVCNDSEATGAGEAGALETAEMLWNANRDVRLATIPRAEGQAKIDVNELVREQGGGALMLLLFPPELLAHRGLPPPKPAGSSFGE